VPSIGITGRAEFLPSSDQIPLDGVFRPYVRAVQDAGGLPLILPAALRPEWAQEALSLLDGLLLSGGGDIDPQRYGQEQAPQVAGVDPERDRSELALVRDALQVGKPILAICRGIQVLNVALGGTLHQDIASEIPRALRHRPAAGEDRDAPTHLVEISAGSRLASILGGTQARVNSFHHQAVCDPGRELVVTARAPDGVIEGLEHRTHAFCVGVQWHPEIARGNQEGMERLFAAFVSAAAQT
jgi:putative glutamine amidotransferase